jgi:hypothetical protein
MTHRVEIMLKFVQDRVNIGVIKYDNRGKQINVKDLNGYKNLSH